MRSIRMATLALLLLACDGHDDGQNSPSQTVSNLPSSTAPLIIPSVQRASGDRWDLQSSGEGVALALLGRSDGTIIRLYCPSGEKKLLVNVRSFRPIGSEERLSIGSGGEAVALVADPRGDAQRGGVSGTGAPPPNLAEILAGSLSASYGAQTTGPHAAVPAELSRLFVASCHPEAKTRAGDVSKTSASACLMQGSERLNGPRLRAFGTEPFWGARIEGRCITYSHPDDQDGTRVWTRYSGSGGGSSWSGALDGRPFILRVRAQPKCSDGMSDRRYPYAVDLTVGGEKRTGCAEIL